MTRDDVTRRLAEAELETGRTSGAATYCWAGAVAVRLGRRAILTREVQVELPL